MNKILIITFANRSFPYDKNMFGQLSRLKFLLNDKQMNNFDKIILISSKGFNFKDDEYPHIKNKIIKLKSTKPSINLFTYLTNLNKHISKEDEITLVSFLPDSEQAGLLGLLPFAILKYNINFYIGLFCTANEYLINFKLNNWIFAKAIRGNLYAYYRFLRVGMMHIFLKTFSSKQLNNRVKFITNSNFTYKSFIDSGYFKKEDENFIIINSGCDTNIYNKEGSMHDQLKICFANRFTNLKGEEIMKRFLESEYIKNSEYKIYITFYTNNNNTTRLIKYLYSAQTKINLSNIVLYQDISKFVNQKDKIRTEINNDIEKLETKYKDFVKNNFKIELFEKTIFKQCAFFLRPSLYDSQPVSIIESLHCGCIPIISNRCGLPTNLSLPSYQIFNIPDEIVLQNKYIDNLYKTEYDIATENLLQSLKYCKDNYNDVKCVQHDLSELDDKCMNERYLKLITKEQAINYQTKAFQDTHSIKNL